jgi:hypothetical protein
MANYWLEKSGNAKKLVVHNEFCDRLVQKWKNKQPSWVTGPVHKQRQLALMYENQSLLYESRESQAFSDTDNQICAATWKDSPIFDMVSVQAHCAPCVVIYHGKDLEEENVAARTRSMKAIYSVEAAQDLAAFHGINATLELVAVVGQELSIEHIREVAQDLRNSAGIQVVCCGTYRANFLSCMDRVDDEMGELISTVPNFAITGPEMAETIWGKKLSNEDKFGYGFGLNVVKYTLADFTVFVDPLFVQGEMVMGYKGSDYDCGYSYNPYVPISHMPVFLDPNSFHPRRGIMTRYSKRLMNKNYYARIKVAK